MTHDLSLYLHIPFCDSKCAYCDFNSYAGMESLIPDYTRALCTEARLWAPLARDRRVNTVFFGGGTPSLLPLAEMRRVMETLRWEYRLNPQAEWSLEANPGTITEPYLRGLRELGFNRLSIGVQSFDDAELRALDRIHSAADAIEAVCAARAAGFDDLNLDLIFGLAGQRLRGWSANLDRALVLRPEHLSLYALTVEPGTALAYQIDQGLAPAPDPDLQADMYEVAQQRLATAGYEQYEISNWSLPGRACRHNLTYWRNGSWLGLGAGAHSCFGGSRFSNALSPRGYIHRVEQALQNGDAPQEGRALPDLSRMPQVVWRERIDATMAMSDTAILGLRLREGLSLAGFRARHGRDFLAVYGDAWQECREAGLVEQSEGRARLSERGLLLANEVFTRLLPAEAAV